MMEGELAGLLAWFVGAMFIPSLALTLGVWTKTNKSFEVTLMIFMFIGVLNNVEALDFMGVVEGSIAAGIPWVYLIISVLLVILAIYGRKRRLQR